MQHRAVPIPLLTQDLRVRQQPNGDTDKGEDGSPDIRAIVGGMICGVAFVTITVYLIWIFYISRHRQVIDCEFLYEPLPDIEDAANRPSNRASVNAAMSIRSSIITRVSARIELAYISSVDGARYGRPAPVVPLLPPIPVAADWPAQTREIGKHNTPSPIQSAAVEILGTGISSEQEHCSLCSRCAVIDLDSIVSLQLHGRLHFVMDLDATKIAKTKTFCSFCSLLSEVQPPPFGGNNARLTLCAIEAPSPRFPSAIGTNLLAVLRLTRPIDEIVPSKIKNLTYIRALNKGQLPGISRSNVDYIPVHDWLNLCHEQHSRCLSSMASPVIPNLNLIDCVSMTLTQPLRF